MEQREVIAKFKEERGASQATIEAANKLVASMNELIAIKDRKELAYIELIKVYQQIDALQDKIIADLEKRLFKPKSTLTKILTALKEIGKAVVFVATGVSLGRIL